MNEQWKNVIITEINIAVYVAPNTGKHIHKNRPYHGLVLNDSESVKDYVFDDGRIMHTEENTIFYLPQGTSYHVETQSILTQSFLTSLSLCPFGIQNPSFTISRQRVTHGKARAITPN